MKTKMKRWLAGLFVALAALGAWPAHVALAATLPEFPSEAYVYLVDDKTGDVLYEQRADERAYPASTTKVMTALVVLDVVGNKLDDKVTVGDEVGLTPEDSTVMGIQAGQTFTWKDLLNGMLIPSGSDAALALATAAGRISAGNQDMGAEDAIAKFVDLMNAKAQELGMAGTHFANVHGFHDDNHYTTARDLYVLATEALKSDVIRGIVSSQSYYCMSDEGGEITVYNTNWLIDETCEEIDESGYLYNEGQGSIANPYYTSRCTGVKTGYTGEAGRCLIFTGAGDEMSMVGVALNFVDKQTIYSITGDTLDAVLDNYVRRTWAETTEPVSISIVNPTLFDRLRGTTTLKASAKEPVTSSWDSSLSTRTQVMWNSDYVQVADDGTATLKTVVTQGVHIATFQVLVDGVVAKEIPLYATADMTPFNNKDVITIVLIAVMALVVLFLVIRAFSSLGRRGPGRSGGRGGYGGSQGGYDDYRLLPLDDNQTSQTPSRQGQPAQRPRQQASAKRGGAPAARSGSDRQRPAQRAGRPANSQGAAQPTPARPPATRTEGGEKKSKPSHMRT